MSQLPTQLYTAAQTRELDRLAIEEYSQPGYSLMCRAAETVFDLICMRWPQAKRIAILCGTGNNGGDGFVIARLLKGIGKDVVVGLQGDRERIVGDALTAYNDYCMMGGDVLETDYVPWSQYDLLVDALFGSGLCRDVTGVYRELIETFNELSLPVVAVDVPSGLNATTGTVMGVAVQADVTVSFIGLKSGLLTNDGPDYSGELFYDRLAIPDDVFLQLPAGIEVITPALFPHALTPRRRNSHKGTYGHVLVIGGAPGYGGAARLAGEAALKTGAGLVTVATHPSNVSCVTRHYPELMSAAVDSVADLHYLADKADVIALGPGLGQTSWAQMVMDEVMAWKHPKVLDADALNLYSQGDYPALDSDMIMTPHPAEAGRLLSLPTARIQEDRFAAAMALYQSTSATCLLKGNGTLVYQGKQLYMLAAGNPGMASAGMGDVLTGIIAGLYGQGLTSLDATLAGAWLHATAADIAAEQGQNGLSASDIVNKLQGLMA